MGEEIYAASAYLSKDPVQLAVVMGQDVAKVVTIGVMGLGAILLAFGSDAIVNLVNM